MKNRSFMTSPQGTWTDLREWRHPEGSPSHPDMQVWWFVRLKSKRWPTNEFLEPRQHHDRHSIPWTVGRWRGSASVCFRHSPPARPTLIALIPSIGRLTRCRACSTGTFKSSSVRPRMSASENLEQEIIKANLLQQSWQRREVEGREEKKLEPHMSINFPLASTTGTPEIPFSLINFKTLSRAVNERSHHAQRTLWRARSDGP